MVDKHSYMEVHLDVRGAKRIITDEFNLRFCELMDLSESQKLTNKCVISEYVYKFHVKKMF